MNGDSTARRFDNHILLTVVGDIMLGDHPVRIGHGVRSSIERNGTDRLFSKVRKSWENSDIVFGNLEVVHSDLGLIRRNIESFEFRGCPDSLATLSKIGFNVLNIANNHCLEHGLDAFWDSIERLKNHNIFPLGLKNKEGRSTPYYCAKNGHTFCMVGYSMCPDKYYKSSKIPYALADSDDIFADIAYQRTQCDSLLVSLHWGEEYMSYPGPKQVHFARKCIDAGATIIAGHHPHVLQGFEVFKSGLILYSLGNFVFDMWQNDTRKTALVNITCRKHSPPALEAHPLFINKHYQPSFVGDRRLKKCTMEINDLSRIIDTLYPEVSEAADVNNHEMKYVTKARAKNRLHRFGDYCFFLCNLYRYNWHYLFQSFKRFMLRKFKKEE